MARVSKKKSDSENISLVQQHVGYMNTRDVLIRCGMEMMTEQGFAATGLDSILKKSTIPKGSFYHHFGSKEAFGYEVIKAYDAYFLQKLDRRLLNDSRAPLDRLADFVSDAKAGMAKYQFTRGCLVGNLTQELGALPEQYRELLNAVLTGWETRIAQCLNLAKEQGTLSNRADAELLSKYFWAGWEGAVMRSRLAKSVGPLDIFISMFLSSLPR